MSGAVNEYDLIEDEHAHTSYCSGTLKFGFLVRYVIIFYDTLHNFVKAKV